ncbi:hypothetical protein FZEAL_2440 [Fusarium zealandicum]|uniref:Uncharacterized protein n=1 Tax=Fusarium zealandicum TaxID=1053134 RepID=A0A8H4XNF7_9HYPO|nr:hypothetical protein FZEAL_2440 [Fusarium zealandicum]
MYLIEDSIKQSVQESEACFYHYSMSHVKFHHRLQESYDATLRLNVYIHVMASAVGVVWPQWMAVTGLIVGVTNFSETMLLALKLSASALLDDMTSEHTQYRVYVRATGRAVRELLRPRLYRSMSFDMVASAA